MSDATRTVRRLALAIALMGLMAPTALGGTVDDPEYTDPSGDAEVLGVDRDSADIVKGWIVESNASLDLHLQVTGAPPLEQTLSQLEGGSWTFSVVDVATNTTWEARAFWTGSEMSAEVRRDGQAEPGAEADATVEENTVVVSWTNYRNFLPAGTLLDETHGYTQAGGSGSTECHGTQVVDCAPDAGFGRTFAVGGEPPSDRAGDVVVVADRSEKAAAPGDEVAFRFAFQNEGDAEANLTLESTAPETWDPAFGNDTVVVPAAGDNATDLVLHVPGDQEPGRVEFSVTATDEDGASATLDLAVDVVESGNGTGPGPGPGQATVSIEANATSAAVEAGQTATYNLTVTNEGDVAKNVTLKVSSDQAAWAELSERSLRLEVNESASVVLTVDVPDDVEAATYTHTVTAQDEANPSDRASVTLSTAVGGSAGPGGVVPAAGLPAVLGALAAGAVAVRLVRRRRDPP